MSKLKREREMALSMNEKGVGSESYREQETDVTKLGWFDKTSGKNIFKMEGLNSTHRDK